MHRFFLLFAVAFSLLGIDASHFAWGGADDGRVEESTEYYRAPIAGHITVANSSFRESHGPTFTEHGPSHSERLTRFDTSLSKACLRLWPAYMTFPSVRHLHSHQYLPPPARA
jgi:hypothetical protein